MAYISITHRFSHPNGSAYIQRCAAVVQRIEAAVVGSTYALQRLSMLRVPVLTGALRASCRVRFVRMYGTFSGRVTYATPYAVYIHENLNIRHPIHARHNCGGDAKYLENPARSLERMILAQIRGAVRP